MQCIPEVVKTYFYTNLKMTKAEQLSMKYPLIHYYTTLSYAHYDDDPDSWRPGKSGGLLSNPVCEMESVVNHMVICE